MAGNRGYKAVNNSDSEYCGDLFIVHCSLPHSPPSTHCPLFTAIFAAWGKVNKPVDGAVIRGTAYSLSTALFTARLHCWHALPCSLLCSLLVCTARMHCPVHCSYTLPCALLCSLPVCTARMHCSYAVLCSLLACSARVHCSCSLLVFTAAYSLTHVILSPQRREKRFLAQL
jgi:hypothetical protein